MLIRSIWTAISKPKKNKEKITHLQYISNHREVGAQDLFMNKRKHDVDPREKRINCLLAAFKILAIFPSINIFLVEKVNDHKEPVQNIISET